MGVRAFASPPLKARCGRILQRWGQRLCAPYEDADVSLPPWAGGLAQAVARDELSLVYQPKLNVRSDRIENVEALLRWTPAFGEPVSPAEFIPVAERCGAIRAITEWVIQTTLADQVCARDAGLDLGFAINLSGRLVTDMAFTGWALDRLRSAAGAITMEITETAMIDDPERALATVRAYADAGIRIAIDDYGAGLSSLAYLKQLPACELKIDRLFIEGLVSSHRDPLLVRSTIDLAHALEMEVTAEGVETAMALSLLRVMGCDQIQGFYLARPMPLDALCAFVAGFEGVEQAAPSLLRPVRRPTVANKRP